MRIEGAEHNDNFMMLIKMVIVNLKNINMPFLNIVAKHDDLVEPTSSKALNDALTKSHDKDLIRI